MQNYSYFNHILLFINYKRPLRGRGYIPKMKHPDDQWLGRQCKEKKYMKLFCLYIMTQVQGNLLPINYVRKSKFF